MGNKLISDITNKLSTELKHLTRALQIIENKEAGPIASSFNPTSILVKTKENLTSLLKFVNEGVAEKEGKPVVPETIIQEKLGSMIKIARTSGGHKCADLKRVAGKVGTYSLVAREDIKLGAQASGDIVPAGITLTNLSHTEIKVYVCGNPDEVLDDVYRAGGVKITPYVQGAKQVLPGDLNIPIRLTLVNEENKDLIIKAGSVLGYIKSLPPTQFELSEGLMHDDKPIKAKATGKKKNITIDDAILNVSCETCGSEQQLPDDMAVEIRNQFYTEGSVAKGSVTCVKCASALYQSDAYVKLPNGAKLLFIKIKEYAKGVN